MNSLMEGYDDETGFTSVQLQAAVDIIKEIQSLADLSAEEIRNKKFDYEYENELFTPEYNFIDTIFPALYNVYDAFVTIEAGCISGEKDIIVECEIEGLSQKYTQSYHIGAALTIMNIKPPASSTKMNLDSAKDSQIRVTLKDKKTGAILDEQSHKVHIASRNDIDYSSNAFGTVSYDNFLCFLSPSSQARATIWYRRLRNTRRNSTIRIPRLKRAGKSLRRS